MVLLQASPRRPFRRLRSFHLNNQTGSNSTAELPFALELTYGRSNDQSLSSLPSWSPAFPSPGRPHRQGASRLAPRIHVPLSTSFVVTILFLVSLFVIACTSLSFLGHSKAKDVFKRTLEIVAKEDPGIVLLGEDVDVDIDEPSIGVRWAILACGVDQYLSRSNGMHGAENCGLPNQYLSIYADSSVIPAFTYDPTQIPFTSQSNDRRSVQNLVQFDISYTLDVRNAHLYPFDTYLLSGTLRAEDSQNRTVRLTKLATIDVVSSWDVQMVDIATKGDGQEPSRDFDMNVFRPRGHVAISMFIFTVNWVLVHTCIVTAILVRKNKEVDVKTCCFAVAGGCFLVKKLRESMPDAPGLDGVLIDQIGFFPNMIAASSCAIYLFVLFLIRERDASFVNSSRGRKIFRHDDSSPRFPEPMEQDVFPPSTGLNHVGVGCT